MKHDERIKIIKKAAEVDPGVIIAEIQAAIRKVKESGESPNAIIYDGNNPRIKLAVETFQHADADRIAAQMVLRVGL